MRLGIVGNLENRRVIQFLDATRKQGLPAVEQVSWLDLLNRPQDALGRLATVDCVRIESAGENAQVQQSMIELGGSTRRLEHGEIANLKEQYQGFVLTLKQLANLNRPFQNAPQDIATMCDKWQSHLRFVNCGIARPQTRKAPTHLSELRPFLRENFGASGRVFLKPRYGSSASGVCAFRWGRQREQLISPLKIQHRNNEPRIYNSLKIQKFLAPLEIDTVLGKLLPQDMIVEQWIPKSRLPDGPFDLRILVVAGESRHAVVRKSYRPMTNLHLGNRRGSFLEAKEHLGSRAWEQIKRLAVETSKCFDQSLYAGVDVLVRNNGQALICEVNAFGDLLPNLLHRGESTYEAIVRAQL